MSAALNLNLKLPAYGRSLLRRRRAGELPWLVIVAEGAVVDWTTLRGRSDVARIGLPPNFPVERRDFRCLFGLDVLVSPFAYSGWDTAAQARRYQATLREIWTRGEPSTLWEVHNGAAWRLHPQHLSGEWFFQHGLEGCALNAELQAEVEVARKGALLDRRGCFSRAEFAGASDALLQQLTG